MTTNEIEFADVERLAKSESPDLADVLAAFLRQPDPNPPASVPNSALTVQRFLSQLMAARSPYYDKAKRKKEAAELWKRYLGQTEPEPAPRFKLTDLVEQLYQANTEPARSALIAIVRVAPLQFGLWGGLKRMYKNAETNLDAQLFGVLAWRFDAELATYGSREVSPGTLVYLRRRAWRFLRQLGHSMPELYPQFAVEVLRHYVEGTNFGSTWVANHIWAHGTKKYNARGFDLRGLPSDLVKHRAYDGAWKASADPLMYLLETCLADAPARFAIQSLRRDFPDKLRGVTPAWLDRLARRPLAGVHEFLVETLQGSAEFHQGKLKAIGLHETVLALLRSPAQKARAYAIEYARAHAQDMEDGRLADFLLDAPDDTKQFAAQMLTGRDAKKLGYAFLGRLLSFRETGKWATTELNKLERKEIPESFLLELLYGSDAQRNWTSQWIEAKYQPGELEAGFWIKVLDDPRQKTNYQATQLSLRWLEKYSAAALPATWMLDALTRDQIGATVARMIRKADSLPGLDVERVKGFVFHPQHRQLAIEVLSNKKLVKPKDLSLPWLLALARRADPSLNQFASRYLLENMKPEDFADGSEREAGIVRLFALATGEKEPEPVRLFAQTYLRCHHPVLGPEQPESKQYSLRPKLNLQAFTAERVWPWLWDLRADVRRWAVAVTRTQVRMWGALPRLYELGESEAKEVRNILFDAMLKAGEQGSDEACTFKLEELDAAKVFALSESRRRPTREAAMEMIRKHYGRLGGAERLGWIMESPDRDVRLFAVRLLWEKHRPRNLPPDWKPKGRFAATIDDAGRFTDVQAMRDFLRRLLFGLPPGRMAEQREDGGAKRKLPASVAKRNVIEVVRDLGLEDESFARLVAPVLEEFTGSLAKGEWQACLAALVQLKTAHDSISLGGTA